MKKVLLTTTAIVGLAGAAAAEVDFSGYAEMGILGGDDRDTQFHNDFDVKFKLSGETDGGLTFGATIDLDEVGGGISHRSNRSSVWIQGDFGTLILGDTNDALGHNIQDVAIGTALTDDHTSHAGYRQHTWFDSFKNFQNIYAAANGGINNLGLAAPQILRYDYSFGDFSVSVSAELDSRADGSEITQNALVALGLAAPTNDPILGIGATWNADLGGTNVRVGVAYQRASLGFALASGTTSVDVAAISLGATFGSGFGAVINYEKGDNLGGYDLEHVAIGLNYQANEWLVSANYGEFNSTVDGAGTEVKTDGWGLVVNYDLGGGAVLMAGYSDSSVDTVGFGAANGNGNNNTLAQSATNEAGGTTFSFGLGLSF